ncbi:hypothetical protein LIER_29852 [Lithospermum erythrorhizon]|uniref:C3H1-type domain-containing protein n=1 Tax=Lithospermum erythrorhizon TaxID=34254 RepID=A0AAV3RKY6_LITER
MHEMGQSFEGQRMENRVKYCKWTFETCPYGQKCQFVHNVEDNSKRVLEGSRDAIVLGGQTRRGQEFDKMNDFKFIERTRKTKLCHKFEKFGSCRFGGDCNYAHGKGELKSLGSVSNLGSEPNAFAANLLTTLPKNHSSRRTGFNSFGLEMKRKKSWFDWDVEKISRIYADWIDLAPAY